MPEINWRNNYSIDESLILYITKNYESIEMNLPIKYNDYEDFVYGIFITTEEQCYVKCGTVTEKGNVIFYIPNIIDTTVIYIISNHKVS